MIKFAQDVFPFFLVAALVIGFAGGVETRKPVTGEDGTWSVQVRIPDCGNGETVNQPAKNLKIRYPERSGDVLTITCEGVK